MEYRFRMEPYIGVELMETGGKETFRVYDLRGVNILNTEDKSEIDHLPKGLYIINGKMVMIGK